MPVHTVLRRYFVHSSAWFSVGGSHRLSIYDERWLSWSAWTLCFPPLGQWLQFFVGGVERPASNIIPGKRRKYMISRSTTWKPYNRLGHSSDIVPILSSTSTTVAKHYHDWVYILGYFRWEPLARYASYEWRKTTWEIRLESWWWDLGWRKALSNVWTFLFFLNPKLISCISSYDELVNEYQVTYLAGGAAQNAARGAADRKSVV